MPHSTRPRHRCSPRDLVRQRRRTTTHAVHTTRTARMAQITTRTMAALEPSESAAGGTAAGRPSTAPGLALGLAAPGVRAGELAAPPFDARTHGGSTLLHSRGASAALRRLGMQQLLRPPGASAQSGSTPALAPHSAGKQCIPSAWMTPVEQVGSPAFLMRHGPASLASHCRPARTIGPGQHDVCALGTGALEHLEPPQTPQPAGQQTTEPERGNFFSIPLHRAEAPTPEAPTKSSKNTSAPLTAIAQKRRGVGSVGRRWRTGVRRWRENALLSLTARGHPPP